MGFFIRPQNKWHFLAFSEISFIHKVVVELTVLMTILIAILPMSLSPYWNGELPSWSDKQQYARMADALLQGHLHIDNGNIDHRLKEMENPYDKTEREKLGVIYNWDEAYYNHHYYMYFGIVPVFLLFIPYKLFMGNALLSYQATQIFAIFTIIGLFYLFYILCKNFFPKFPFSLYLILSSAFSILSIGYSISAPALYCTAIVSAVCLMVWSINCFLHGAWLEKDNKSSTIYLLAGALLGALSFGCRPPTALANLIVLAVGYRVYRNSVDSVSDKSKKVLCLLLPYLVIGILLMMYNYARFDNVFEFGQSYQLTVADQHNYRSFMERFNIKMLIAGLIENFCDRATLLDAFPYIFFNGVFVNFPILLFSVRIFNKDVARCLKEKNLYFISCLFFGLPFFITLFEVYWAPILLERYRLDLYYLLCIASFMAIAAWMEIISQEKRKIIRCVLTVLSFSVFVIEFLFFCLPYDGSYTLCYPQVLDEIYRGLRLGL